MKKREIGQTNWKSLVKYYSRFTEINNQKKYFLSFKPSGTFVQKDNAIKNCIAKNTCLVRGQEKYSKYYFKP